MSKLTKAVRTYRLLLAAWIKADKPGNTLTAARIECYKFYSSIRAEFGSTAVRAEYTRQETAWQTKQSFC